MNTTLLWIIAVLVLGLVVERIATIIHQLTMMRRINRLMLPNLSMPPIPPTLPAGESQQERAARVQIEFMEKMTRKLDDEDEGWKP